MSDSRPNPLLGYPVLGLCCLEQENGLCCASLSQTTLVFALFKVLVSPSAPAPENGSIWPGAKGLFCVTLPSQARLHLPAQQQGGRLRLQATLVLGLWPNHTGGLGREAPCPATWQSGQEGGKEGAGTAWCLGEAAQVPLIPGAHSCSLPGSLVGLVGW